MFLNYFALSASHQRQRVCLNQSTKESVAGFPPRFYALFLCCIIMILVNKVHLKMDECRLMVFSIIFSVTLGNSPMS